MTLPFSKNSDVTQQQYRTETVFRRKQRWEEVGNTSSCRGDERWKGSPGPSPSVLNVPTRPVHTAAFPASRERCFRLLFTLRNMKRAVRRTGLAANEPTVGGRSSPHVSAAPGPRETRHRRHPKAAASEAVCGLKAI